MRVSIFSLTCLILLNCTFVKGQGKRDSTDNLWHNWNTTEWFHWEEKLGKPFIELNYGLGSPSSDKLVTKFSDLGLEEIKLGYVSRKSDSDESIFQFRDKYAFVSYLSTNLKSGSPATGQLKTDLLRFGFAHRSGYGYAVGTIRIIPYYGSSILWSRLNLKNSPSDVRSLSNPPVSSQNALIDSNILDRFSNEFRFGTLSEGGVRLDIASTVSFNAGFETAVIFPRYMFWKHVGNIIVEEASFGLLNKFIDEVAYSSPYTAPVVNFLLKNGLSYTFFSLKKEKMNWPFETEAPLTYQTFKFGVTFTF